MKNETTQNSSSSQNNLKSIYFDVADHPVIWRWMLETSKRDPQSFRILIQDNTLFFKKLLGKPNWYQKQNNLEWTHRWLCAGQGLTWLIQTGPRGTVFRIKSHSQLDKFKQESNIGLGGISYLKEILTAITGAQC